jgi:hypothetical protein
LALQLPANGVFGQPLAAVPLQVVPQQRDCPADGGVTQPVGRLPQRRPQELAQGLIPQRRPPRAVGIGQVEWLAPGLIELYPVINALPAYAQGLGHVAQRLAAIQFEQRQQATVKPRLLSTGQRRLQLLALRRREMDDAHGSLRLGSYRPLHNVSKTFCGTT